MSDSPKDEPGDDYASVSIELTEDHMESLRHGSSLSCEFEQEDGGILAVHVERADKDLDKEWLLGEKDRSLIARVSPVVKHHLAAMGILVVAGMAAGFANSYTTYLPPEVFAVGGFALAMLVMLRWALEARVNRGDAV